MAASLVWLQAATLVISMMAVCGLNALAEYVLECRYHHLNDPSQSIHNIRLPCLLVQLPFGFCHTGERLVGAGDQRSAHAASIVLPVRKASTLGARLSHLRNLGLSSRNFLPPFPLHKPTLYWSRRAPRVYRGDAPVLDTRCQLYSPKTDGGIPSVYPGYPRWTNRLRGKLAG